VSPALFLQIVTEVCLPIFAVVGFGWLLDRRFSLNLETLVKINIYLLVPAFVFVRLLDTPLAGGEAARVMFCTLSVILIAGLLAGIVGRVLGMDSGSKKSLALASMFGNCGNFGIPLVTLAFGNDAAAVQVYVLVVMNVSTFTFGLFLANNGAEAISHRRALLSTIRQPALYAVLTAAVCKALHLDVRHVTAIWQPLDILATALVGTALLTLGVQLSQTKPAPLQAPLLSALSIRLLAAPLIAWGITQAMHFPPHIASVLILTAGAPTAVNTALLAHEFGGNTAFATASVYYSTLLSLLTTSLCLAILRWWIG
jgi:malate permease and related proteins